MAAAGGLLIAAGTHWSIRWGRWRRDNYRNEQRYLSILRSLQDFNAGFRDTEQSGRLIEEIRLALLHFPDDVKAAGSAFLARAAAGTDYSGREKQLALAKFVFAMSRDLNRR